MIKESWLSWPFGIIAVLLYAYSCYTYNIYGEMTLQIMYVIISFYGWYNWTSKKGSHSTLRISKLKTSEYLKIISLGVILSLLFYIPLSYYKSSLPILDAITNGFSIVATLLAAKKKIDNWLLWIPINILIVGIMLYKEMYFYSILYICYTLFAIYGFYQWKRHLK